MSLEEFCLDAEQLCYSVAPRDLSEWPLYVLVQSALPTLAARSCDGYTAPSLDLCLRQAIGPAWRGRGPCMVIHDSSLADEHAEDFDHYFIAVVLHELAHILERGWTYAEPANVDPQRIQFESLVLADAVAHDPLPSRLPYAGHEDRFIRVCLHVCARANRLGVHIGPALLCAGKRFMLSHACMYAEALGDEPASLAHRSFRDILTQRPPQEFSLLWHEDVLRAQLSC